LAVVIPALTDEDATRTIVRALRLLAIMTVIAAPLVGWKLGWQSAALLVSGAAISAAGLWKWLRLMTVVIARMDVSQVDGNTGESIPGQARPLGTVLVGFFGTMGLMLVVLYGSLKLLDGSVYALFAGLGMGILALTVEALRLAKAWTV
jgi:hypothetical protein